MKEFMANYFKEGTGVSSKRVNVFIFICLFIVLSGCGIFTTWVKNTGIYSDVLDAIMFIVIGGTLGVAATDVFFTLRRREKQEPEPEPKPEPKPEPVPEPPAPPAPVSSLNVDLNFIRTEEGFRSNAYQCSARVWTLGFGNTTHPDGRKVKKGDTITEEQAETYLQAKTKEYLAALNLPTWMNKNQRTAVLSWVYNCGIGAWNKSMLKTLVLSQAPEAKIRERWTSKYLTAQGSKKPVLKPRRQREVDLYFKPINE